MVNMENKMTKIAGKGKLSLAILSLFLFLSPVSAQEAPQVIRTVKLKEVRGEVSGISSNFIAVLYGKDADTSYEIALNTDAKTRVERKNSLKDIAVGDTVFVSYEETIETKKGEKPRILGRVVKLVRFLRAAEKQPEIDALVSSPEEGETPLETEPEDSGGENDED